MEYDNMMIFENNISKELNNLMTSITKYITPKQTTKFENEQLEYVRPLIDTVDAEKIIQQSPILNKVIRVLAQDVILNNYTLDVPKINDNTDPEIPELTAFNEFWNDNNKYQLYLAAIEYYKFGYAALEIRYNECGEPVKIEQIPALSIKIRIQRFDDKPYYYLEQQIDNHVHLLRISHSDESMGTDYSLLDEMGVDDGSTGYAVWIGGGTVNTWYTMPYWVSAKTSVLTSLYIDELNYEKISKGNIPSGILMVEGSYRRRLKEDNGGLEEQLKQQLNSAGCGTAMVYMEGITPDARVDTEYIKLEDDNYDHLILLQKSNISTILEVYGVPKIRLMIDDITESMNSNKSVTLYEIYNKSLMAEQVVFKEMINCFSHDELGIVYNCIMGTPEFNDKTNIKVTTVTALFEQGLLTLGQATEYLSKILPEINFDGLTDSEELTSGRFYKGSLLGDGSELMEEEMPETEDELFQQLEQKVNEAEYNEQFMGY